MPFLLRLTLTCFFLLVIFKANAQNRVTYTFENGRNIEVINIVNNPSNFPPLKLGVSMSHLSHPLDRNNGHFRVSGEYMMGDWGYVQFFKDLVIINQLDRQFMQTDANFDKRGTDNPLAAYNYTEGGLGVKVWRDKTKGTKTLPLKRENAGYEDYSGDYIALIENSISARGGLFHYRNTVSNPYVEGKVIKSEDGETIAGKEAYTDKEGNPPDDPMNDPQRLFHTNMFVTSIYLGAEYSTKYSVDYTVEDRDRGKASLLRFYGDLLLGTEVFFEDMILNRPGPHPTSVNVAHDNEGGLKARNVGFRFGIFNQGFRGVSAFSWRIESGIRPGMANVENPYDRLMGNDLFLNLTIGYTLGIDPKLF